MKTRLCSVDDLVENQAQRFVLNDVALAAVKDATGNVSVIGDTCTHGEISLSDGFVADGCLECWAHGSRFSLETGEPQNLPAYEAVPVFEVTIVENDVYVDPSVTKES